MSERQYFYDNDRFVWRYKGHRYHKADFKNGKAYLCDCLPWAMVINGVPYSTAWSKRLANNLTPLHRQVIFEKRMDKHYGR